MSPYLVADEVIVVNRTIANASQPSGEGVGKPPETKDRTKAHSFLLLTSVAAVSLVMVGTSRYGVGISPDSVAYISAARNLLSGGGLVSFDGYPFVHWPPLYPALLTLIGLGGFDPVDAARFVNALSFGAIVLISGRWLLGRIDSLLLVVLGSLSVLLSKSLVTASLFAWTEPLFILFALLSLFEIERFLESGKRQRFFSSLALAALACLTRYVGVAVILTGTIRLLLRRDVSSRDRIVDATAFALLSALPSVVWVVRNYAASETVAGMRAASPYTLVQNVYLTFDTVTAWFLPSNLPFLPRIVLLSLLFSSVAIVSTQVLWSRHRFRANVSPGIVSILGFSLSYVLFLLGSATAVAFDPIGDRLLSPIYVPLMLLAIYALDRLRKVSIGHLSRRALSGLILVGVGLWLAYPLLQVGKVVTRGVQDGAGGFSITVWRESPLIDHLRRHPLPDQVYSNIPDGLYILTGTPAGFSPRKYQYNSPSATLDDLAKFQESLVENGDSYIVWFENKPEGKDRQFLYGAEELKSALDMETVAIALDGAIYVVRSDGLQTLMADGPQR